MTGLSLDECPHGDIAVDLAEGMKSLAAAVEMCSIELASLRYRLENALRQLAKRTERT